MNRSISNLAVGSLSAFAALIASRNADAQPYYCPSNGSSCFEGITTGGAVDATFQSTGASQGAVNANDSTTGVGLVGSSNTGTGVFGGTDSNFQQNVSGHFGVYGVGSGLLSIGGYFTSPYAALAGEATGSGGTGVYGTATGSGSNAVYGVSDVGSAVYGTTSGTDGKGVTGYAGGSGGYGVWGEATSNVGVYGTATNSGGVGVQGETTGRYAVYAGDTEQRPEWKSFRQ
jgi:hypothetical protein